MDILIATTKIGDKWRGYDFPSSNTCWLRKIKQIHTLTCLRTERKWMPRIISSMHVKGLKMLLTPVFSVAIPSQSLVATSADSVPSSKTNIFQSKLIYCRHFRTYSWCAMFDWSDAVFRRRNVTRRRISNTVLQPRYWGREADSPEVCHLSSQCHIFQPQCTWLYKLFLNCIRYE